MPRKKKLKVEIIDTGRILVEYKCTAISDLELGMIGGNLQPFNDADVVLVIDSNVVPHRLAVIASKVSLDDLISRIRG